MNTMAEVALNLVVIRSADLERSAAFYAALGVRLGPEQHGSGPPHLAGAVGAVVLEVYPRGEASDTTGVRLGFRVPAVAAAVTAAAAAGAIVSPPRPSPWGLRAVVADPDGHRVELTEAPAGA